MAFGTVGASRSPPPSGRPAALRQALIGGLAVVAIGGAAWNIWRQLNPPDPYAVDLTKPFQFLDDAQSNVPLDDAALQGLEFRTVGGDPLTLGSFRGRKNVILVVTRGRTSGKPPGAYAGRICLYCASQTSRLIANYAALRDHEAEVVVVFPIGTAAETGSIKDFTAAVKADAKKFDGVTVDKAPFPVVLDVGCQAVDRLGLRADLARPSTFIIDKEGHVRFAHVGQSLADRPSVKALLSQFEMLAPPDEPAP